MFNYFKMLPEAPFAISKPFTQIQIQVSILVALMCLQFYVISVVGEQIHAPWIKTPQKDRRTCQLRNKASDSKGCPPTKL